MRRHAWLALVVLGMLAPQARAATAYIATPPPAPANCLNDVPQAHLGGASSVDVELDSDTIWRPQGSQVRFTISGTNGGQPQIAQVFTCFRWRRAPTAQNLPTGDSYIASPQVISLHTGDGTIQYGAVVPNLPDHTVWGVQRTSLYIVPVASMLVLVQFTDGSWAAADLPVGITKVWLALVILGVSIALAVVVLWALAPPEFTRNAPKRGFAAVSQHALALIASNEGVASLAQLQILIWTFVVAGAAIYVMVLSGNLIPISDGMLLLLGISSGTTIAVRLTPTGETVPAGTLPSWPQLFQKRLSDVEVDVTRVQMLIFTLVAAVFVSVQVVATYNIPDIPTNMLILMGISNTVYLAGRRT